MARAASRLAGAVAGLAGADVAIARPESRAWRAFARNRGAVVGLVIFVGLVLTSVAGPLVYRVDPFAIVSAPLLRPGEDGLLLGTDYLGRDMLAGLVRGGRTSLAVGGTAALLTMTIGIGIGALAGFHGRAVDQLLMRVTEFFQVLPPLLFAMALVTLFSPSLATIAAAIGLVSWPTAARLTRAEFLRIRHLEYVAAARAIGAGTGRIIWRVILPNAGAPLIVSGTLAVGLAMLFESGLSFLGLGDPNVMSWGMMIGANRNYMLEAWWVATIPGLTIFLAVLSVSLIGDGLTDALNPAADGGDAA